MNIWNWLSEIYAAGRIPINIVAIILVAIIIRAILLAASNRVIRKLVDGAHKKNGASQNSDVPEDVRASRQVQRTQTMGTVFHNTISWTIYVLAFIQVLQEVGVSVTAIVASAGIGAAALGFGAQNIIKDVLSGMFLVFEDQLGVGDQVDLGLAVGTVDSVGLRITTLHDAEGTIWFVRNGEIVRVGNKSYGKTRKIVAITKRGTSAKKK